MLATPEARSRRHELDERLNPGYRHAEPARLLADAYALALTAAEQTTSARLRRDCLDAAIRIEDFLLDTLSEVRISRGDVEARFEELRADNPAWPDIISTDAWIRLAGSRTLRDIADVVCGGGDYWEAINVALDDEFSAPATRSEWSPATLYYAMERADFNDLILLAPQLEGSAQSTLSSVLDRVRERTRDRFAMVVWSVEDILTATARAKGIEVEFGDEATWEQAGVDRAWVEGVMAEASSAMSDRMTEVGWDVLEDTVSSLLPDDN